MEVVCADRPSALALDLPVPGRAPPALLRVEPLAGKTLAKQIGVRCFGKAEHHVVNIVAADAVVAWGEAHTTAEAVHRFMVPRIAT
jgi:hypothetical protein